MSMPTHRWGAPYRCLAWVLIASLLAASCATRNVPPIGAGGKPFKPESDEVRLWSQAEKEEEALAKKAKIYDDPLLEEYLGKLGDRLLPDEVRAAGGPGFRFGVMSDPTLNAFAMPNGRVYVHSGLLSRLDNEAQLAMILGHEMPHVASRHALRFTRGVAVAGGSRQKAGDPIGAEVISQTAHAILGLGLTLAYAASVTGYSRDLEREADQGGMEKLVRAGYDPNEAPKVFQLLLSESKDRGSLETFFFGSHPKLQERITTTTELVNSQYAAAAAAADRVKTSEEFGLRMRTVVRENALLDIRVGRFKLAQAQLDRVAAITPKDPTLHLYYGDLYRLQSQRARGAADKDDFARKALEHYERSADLDPAFPDPFRQLGFLYYQQKETDRAREAFRKYLALKPDAPDAKRIREYLVELER